MKQDPKDKDNENCSPFFRGSDDLDQPDEPLFGGNIRRETEELEIPDGPLFGPRDN